jgi:hypothetical protein
LNSRNFSFFVLEITQNLVFGAARTEHFRVEFYIFAVYFTISKELSKRILAMFSTHSGRWGTYGHHFSIFKSMQNFFRLKSEKKLFYHHLNSVKLLIETWGSISYYENCCRRVFKRFIRIFVKLLWNAQKIRVFLWFFWVFEGF